MKIQIVSSIFRLFIDHLSGVCRALSSVCLCVRTITFELNDFYLDIWRAGSAGHYIDEIQRSRS